MTKIIKLLPFSHKNYDPVLYLNQQHSKIGYSDLLSGLVGINNPLLFSVRCGSTYL